MARLVVSTSRHVLRPQDQLAPLHISFYVHCVYSYAERESVVLYMDQTVTDGRPGALGSPYIREQYTRRIFEQRFTYMGVQPG